MAHTDHQDITTPIKDLLGSVKALATTHNLLTSGGFNLSQLHQIQICLPFLKELYDKALASLLAHPEAVSDPEASKLREQWLIEKESERLVRETEVEAATKKAIGEINEKA